jgi:hypothetical protein
MGWPEPNSESRCAADSDRPGGDRREPPRSSPFGGAAEPSLQPAHPQSGPQANCMTGCRLASATSGSAVDGSPPSAKGSIARSWRARVAVPTASERAAGPTGENVEPALAPTRLPTRPPAPPSVDRCPGATGFTSGTPGSGPGALGSRRSAAGSTWITPSRIAYPRGAQDHAAARPTPHDPSRCGARSAGPHPPDPWVRRVGLCAGPRHAPTAVQPVDVNDQPHVPALALGGLDPGARGKAGLAHPRPPGAQLGQQPFDVSGVEGGQRDPVGGVSQPRQRCAAGSESLPVEQALELRGKSVRQRSQQAVQLGGRTGQRYRWSRSTWSVRTQNSAPP